MDKSNWAVTFIVAHPKCLCCSNYRPAKLVIEGISDGTIQKYAKKGKHFVIVFYVETFYGTLEIETQCIPQKDLKYQEKSGTWVKSSAQVKARLADVEKDTTKPFKYSVFGKYSIESRGCHNTATWAREKLQVMGVTMSKSRRAWFHAKTTDFTHRPNRRSNFLVSLFRKVFNGAKKKLSNFIQFNKSCV
ncbi:putative uncharacterized protein [Parachlamydia acanthamoebae UV-7]|uniref:Uncharacterized protein n=2 Tax=Parachlamydia acanthamoebae TaxID=83552 RepID=F8KW64_PARAV|nr:hypothetical protein [Parachlamydia acanthamoebae]KIA78546.1 hypothetical protein DB43_DU00130 [Parachlamydia acanthamoebae]CCB85716.1 putative uncharacterized protein [Parachlamydia acanthamoebae UV-7]